MRNFGVLYLFELKKIRRQKLTLISLLLSAVLIAAAAALGETGTGTYYIYDAERDTVSRVPRQEQEVEDLRRSFLCSLSGRTLDEETMEQLKENYSDSSTGTAQWNLNEYAPFLYLNVNSDRAQASAGGFYRERASSIKTAAEHSGLTGGELEYWERQAERLDPITLEYAGGWMAFLEKCGLISLLTVLLVSIGLCRLFFEEHQYRTDQLALSSAKGKTVLFFARCAAGISYAAGAGLFLFLLLLGVCGILCGLDGFAAPLQLWETGSFSALHLSMGELALTFLGLLLLAAAMTAVFVMLLSELFRGAVPAMVISFLLAAAGAVDFFGGKGGLIEQAANYLPSVRISLKTLEDYYLISGGEAHLNSVQFSFILYPLLTVVFGVLCRWCYRNYQVTGR